MVLHFSEAFRRLIHHCNNSVTWLQLAQGGTMLLTPSNGVKWKRWETTFNKILPVSQFPSLDDLNCSLAFHPSSSFLGEAGVSSLKPVSLDGLTYSTPLRWLYRSQIQIENDHHEYTLKWIDDLVSLNFVYILKDIGVHLN